MSILFFVAIAILLGFIGGKLFNLIKMPGVVGYLVAGLVLGPSFFDIFNAPLLDRLSIFPAFALSLIAFIIGSEMKLETLRQLGRGIGIITIAESFGAFFLVATGVYVLTGKLYLALIFGALAPASAPAGTVAVLQEYKSKGRLTNALYAVVGLDDGLAIMIFAVAVALSKMLLTGRSISVGGILEGPVFEICGSIVLGCVIGVITGYFTRRVHGRDGILAVSVGGILICAGLADYFHFSLILANLSLGMIFVNLFPVANRRVYEAIQSISLPIYIIFFFIAGASLQIGLLPSMGILGLVYVICRIGGLMGGAYLGAAISKQNRIIRRYLGFGILSQAGVAIGLAVLVAGEFDTLGEAGAHLSIVTVNTIAATTILFEVIGPIGTKFAISKAGEIGVNITEEDLIKTHKVADVVDTSVPAVSAGLPLSEVIKIVSSTDYFYYPVIDDDNNVLGAITLAGIRNTFTTQELNDWLVALDIMEPVTAKISSDMLLAEAFAKARQLGVEHIPVVAGGDGDKLIGVLDCAAVRRQLSAKVLAKQREAESIYNS